MLDQLIISYGFLIPMLVFFSVIGLGGAVITALWGRQEHLHKRLHRIAQREGLLKDAKGSAAAQIAQRMGKTVSGRGPSKGLLKELTQAGFYDHSAASIFMGLKVILFLGGLSISLLGITTIHTPLSSEIALVIIGTTVPFFLPNFYIHLRISQRSAEIKSFIPDMVDLLEICVSGGMGLDMAWNSVGDEIRSVCPMLSDEMALTNLEIHLGADRGAAMRNMAERTKAQELSSLVAVLIESQRFGTSIAEALRTYAQSMRELRSQRAEEKAEKLGISLIIPMILFFFPVVLIVATGPACITIIQIFSEN